MSTLLNLDDLLGQSLESVEAAPEFVQLENGVYTLTVSETKADESKEKKAEDKLGLEGKSLEELSEILKEITK